MILIFNKILGRRHFQGMRFFYLLFINLGSHLIGEHPLNILKIFTNLLIKAGIRKLFN